MMDIGTLTMNPALDVACQVDRVRHTRKLRARGERCDPGGGGINVARVFVRFGGNARCYYLSGGATGVALNGLLDLHQLVRTAIPIGGSTRVSTTIFEASTAREYRFVPQGPEIAEREWRECLDLLSGARHDFLVASGSLPRGVPDDFYARVAEIAAKNGMRFVLDTSGPALAAALAGGNVFLAKPSLGEFRSLVGEELVDDNEISRAAKAVVDSGQAELLAVTMSNKGALLASREGQVRLPALPVEARSTVGAGDSFLAAMVFALAEGQEATDAFRFGVAAGAAAVMTPGTDLCHADDVRRFFSTAA